MTYTTTSPKAVIAKIYRDYKPNNSSWINDAYEWMGEALDCIRPFNGYVEQCKRIQVVDYRGKLPCDIQFLIGVSHNGEQIKRTGFIPNKVKPTDSTKLNKLPNNLYDTYSLNPNYIITSFKEGYIDVYYNGLATDEEGFPLIPDIYEIKEALSWFILMKMCLRGFKHPVVTFQLAEQQWKTYYPQAQNACKMPDIDGYDLFKRTYLGLVDNIEKSNNFFSDNTAKSLFATDDISQLMSNKLD